MASQSAGYWGPNLDRVDYGFNKTILFNCSVYLVDSPTDSRPVPLLDVHDVTGSLTDYFKLPEVHIIGLSAHNLLRQSLALSAENWISESLQIGGKEAFRDFNGPYVFKVGVGRNRTSELWLAAYIGNYIGNCLSYLNDLLQWVQIEPESNVVKTKLLVKWGRVGVTLGGLAIFQVLLGLAALWYCHRNFEIVDDVSTFSSMFTDFPFVPQEDKQQAGAVHHGKFVPEGDGFRWVLVTRKDVKVA